MSLSFDDLTIQHQLWIGSGTAPIFGFGPLKTRGAVYVEGPQIVGNGLLYSTPSPTETGSLMVGPCTNPDAKAIPFYSLFVKFFARIQSYLKIDFLLSVPIIKSRVILTRVLKAKIKNFQIDHPLDPKNKYLVHSSLEGPEIGIYVRGRISNQKEIELPKYWSKLVNPRSISVQLQPIGAHQDIIVKRVSTEKIILQSKGANPIDCYYHVFGERTDVSKLKVEINK